MQIQKKDRKKSRRDFRVKSLVKIQLSAVFLHKGFKNCDLCYVQFEFEYCVRFTVILHSIFIKQLQCTNQKSAIYPFTFNLIWILAQVLIPYPIQSYI